MIARLISLEGLPCAGKTTSYNSFNNDLFIKIPELYIKITKKDTNDSILKKYSDSEIKKYLKVKNLNKRFVISDRSFVSTLAFSYAKKLLFNNGTDWVYNLNFLKEYRHKILIPELIIVFDIPVEASQIKRIALGRKEDDKYWSSKVFLSYFSDFYKSNEYGELFPETQTIFIDSYRQDKFDTFGVMSEIIISFIKDGMARTPKFEHQSCI